ncbi:peptide ABC transporter ATP-binding protein [Izhakiella australiensis]|uniref:ABC-type dipeptide transporter n=1 Tax=Izhakiella australiensis TaxID=1926881 RepID=A0A1S8YQW7_9GAMM|nr:ABC transporter ATP-binding protein [Izhakiella australiensis]OON41043.1 peptide ABC transporter ATP-binding protein [Izhakiella australiensis]
MSLLDVQDLTLTLRSAGKNITALNRLTFHLDAGETLAVVGESGCGKSMTALAIMGLLPAASARITHGSIRFDNQDLTRLSVRQYQQLRGQRIAMIFQDAMSALNPVKTIGSQLMEVLQVHLGISRHAAHERAIALLARVKIPDAARRMTDYPHQLSGGMSQRVMIAMAIACEPRVLIADEPTTALDVTIQAQILQLLRDIQRETGMALLLITHDLGVVAAMAQRVAVMYAGRIIEQASVLALFDNPIHPYTQGLLRSTPKSGQPGERLYAIPGRVPPLNALPSGCAFRNRCPLARQACSEQIPEIHSPRPQHGAACLVNAPAQRGEEPYDYTA